MLRCLCIMVACIGILLSSGFNTNEVSAQAKEFKQTLSWLDYSFTIEAKDNKLYFKPSNLEIVNREEVHDITGYTINNAQIGDLNNDGYPEVFIYLTANGSGRYGQLIGYACNNGKSMSIVYLQPVEDNKEIAKNYRGHDFMMMQGNTFIRLFPIYLENDVNANPTGGVRKLEYKLVDGEASRILKLVKATDYKVVDEKIIN